MKTKIADFVRLACCFVGLMLLGLAAILTDRNHPMEDHDPYA